MPDFVRFSTLQKWIQSASRVKCSTIAIDHCFQVDAVVRGDGLSGWIINNLISLSCEEYRKTVLMGVIAYQQL